MRIHTDILTRDDLWEALPSGVLAYITPHGSRSRARAFEVTLYVAEKDELHRRFGNSGGYGASSDVAATWDEWGIWMQRLYELDPEAVIGWYKNYAHFVEVTRNKRNRVWRNYKGTSIQHQTHKAPWLDA